MAILFNLTKQRKPGDIKYYAVGAAHRKAAWSRNGNIWTAPWVAGDLGFVVSATSAREAVEEVFIRYPTYTDGWSDERDEEHQQAVFICPLQVLRGLTLGPMCAQPIECAGVRLRWINYEDIDPLRWAGPDLDALLERDRQRQ